MRCRESDKGGVKNDSYILALATSEKERKAWGRRFCCGFVLIERASFENQEFCYGLKLCWRYLLNTQMEIRSIAECESGTQRSNPRWKLNCCDR